MQQLTGMPKSAQSIKLSVGGKMLTKPDELLLESRLPPFSEITCEHVPLYGGMQASAKIQDS